MFLDKIKDGTLEIRLTNNPNHYANYKKYCQEYAVVMTVSFMNSKPAEYMFILVIYMKINNIVRTTPHKNTKN